MVGVNEIADFVNKIMLPNCSKKGLLRSEPTVDC